MLARFGDVMELHIKDDESCQLARELASLTGDTMAGAVTLALRERLDRELRTRTAEERLRGMRAIAERCASLMKPGPSATEHGDFLYDDRGVPG